MTAEVDLLDTLGATVQTGRWLDDGLSDTPTVVLGATAARRLGITSLTGSPLVWIGDQWFAVVGILDPVPLLGSLDSSVFIGGDAATTLLDWDGKVSTIFVRTPPKSVNAVRDVLAATVNPLAPNEVEVSRPTDALEARSAVDRELTALLLGLGGVALLVGGIGIANVMVISVLERRSEIGVRRAIGATRRHIRLQFLTEAAILASIGGVGGALLGSAVTAGYARDAGRPVLDATGRDRRRRGRGTRRRAARRPAPRRPRRPPRPRRSPPPVGRAPNPPFCLLQMNRDFI